MQTLAAGTQPANPAGTPAPEGGEQGAREPLPAKLDAPDNELEYVEFAYYGRVIPPGVERPPRDVDEPRLWTLTDDTARALAEKRSRAAYDEYLHLGCYAFLSSCANEAMRGALESLSTESATAASKAAALAELRACYRTHLATEEATRSRLSYLQLAKNGPTATETDRVFAELAHAKFCTPRRIAVSGQLDQLCRAFDDKTLEISLIAAGKARAAAAFAKAIPTSPPPQRHYNKWVSRMFLVPKPGTNKWRLIIDLRELNKWCKTFTMSCETLKHLRHLARAGDWLVSMDLADGYYALGIREEDRDFFTVNYRGELWRLARLPMVWTGSSYYFCKLTAAFTDYLRTPLKRRDPALPPTAPSKPTRRFLRNTRWRGERLLPYMDDFLFLADSREAALGLRVRLNTLLDRLGLLRNPNKGVWEPTQVGPHLGLIVDLYRGEFRAPEEKLIALAKAASSLLGRAASNKRWLPARQLASFAGKVQFLYLAITPARFFLRELHCVLATRQCWGGRVKMTNQLLRDIKWWNQVPAQHNGRSMYKPVETAYLHADSSTYGWGAVLNNNNAYKARGFWYEDDRSRHITWKELRTVRHAVESFLPQLRGRRVLLHEDNTAVVAALANLTSWSPVMMEELRKLWHLLDIHDISISPRYIQSAANGWADRLSRELDNSDWQLNPRIFAYLQRLWARARQCQ
eukprot:jgi/Tetstr1/458637/TSEL_004341.t1